MAILNINTDYTGQVGVLPRTVKILTSDSYATITTAGWLNEAIAMGYNFLPTDIFVISYADNAFGTFAGAISGSSITLSAAISQGSVTLPVVSGNFPVFSGTSGLIADSKISPSDATKTKVASVAAATVVNQIATFSDTAGTVQSSGTLLSAVQLSANIKAAQFPYAGGSSTATFNITGLVSTSIITGDIVTSTNPAVINNIKILTPGVATVVFSADPGASTINLMAIIVAQ